MANKTHEEVLLMSNSNQEVYPQNRPHNFTVQLASPLNLIGKWECGMSLIEYPNKWMNIRTTSTFKYCWQIKHKTSSTIVNVEQGSLLRPGYFDSVKSLVDMVNDDILEVLEGYMATYSTYEFVKAPELGPKPENTRSKVGGVEIPYFKYLNDAVRVSFSEGEINDFKIKIEEGFDLWKAIGYHPTVKEITQRKALHYHPSLTMNFPALYVYTPILTPWRVGNTAAPLLSIVPIRGKYNHYGENEPARIHYREVCQSYISEIEVKIMDAHGKEVQFGDGIVGIELEFRRIA